VLRALILAAGLAPAALAAAPPDADPVIPDPGEAARAADVDDARRRAAEALERAGVLARDPALLRELAREAETAGAAGAKALDDLTPAQRTAPLPQPDPTTAARAREDLHQLLADPGAALRALRADGAMRPAEPPPVVLVSFAMPEDALRDLLAEAGRIGAPVLLRGLVEGSLRATLERAARLSEPAGGTEGAGPAAGLAIDPTLFERFDIEAVPAFVVSAEPIAPCTRGGCETPPHARVAGGVSLTYALGVIAREAEDPAVRAAAARWQARLAREDGSDG